MEGEAIRRTLQRAHTGVSLAREAASNALPFTIYKRDAGRTPPLSYDFAQPARPRLEIGSRLGQRAVVHHIDPVRCGEAAGQQRHEYQQDVGDNTTR